MGRFTIIAVLVAVLAAGAIAQPVMDGFELTDYWRADGFRVFFDDSVDWSWGGTLQSPVTEFWQTEATCEAWLVLVEPSAASLGGFRFGRRLEGNFDLVAEELLNGPLTSQLVDDVYDVTYDSPLPLDGSPVLLMHWLISNSSFEPLLFYFWPAPGDARPTYWTGTGTFVEGNTHGGDYHQYVAPAAMLNGGVTPNEERSWGDVKSLFR